MILQFSIALILVLSFNAAPLVTAHSYKVNSQHFNLSNKTNKQNNVIYNFTEFGLSYPHMNFNITNKSNFDASFFIKSDNFTGGYYLTNNNSLACFQVKNQRYRWLANVPYLNYQYMDYKGVYYILMPYYNSKGILSEIVSYGANSNGYLESFYYNLHTHKSFVDTEKDYITYSSNLQLNYLGNNTSSVIFCNDKMLIFNIVDNSLVGSYLLPFFEANNIYYISQWKIFVNIQATNSNKDDVYIYSFNEDTVHLIQQLNYLPSGTLEVGGVPDIVIYGTELYFQAQGPRGTGYSNVILNFSKSNRTFSILSSNYNSGNLPSVNFNPPNDYIPIITHNGFLPLLPGGYSSPNSLFYNIFDSTYINSSNQDQNATELLKDLVGYSGNDIHQGISSFSYNFTNMSELCMPDILQHKMIILFLRNQTNLDGNFNVSVISNIDNYSINISGCNFKILNSSIKNEFKTSLQWGSYNFSLKYYGKYIVSREILIYQNSTIWFNTSKFVLFFKGNGIKQFSVNINNTTSTTNNGSIIMRVYGFDYNYTVRYLNRSLNGSVNLNQNRTILISNPTILNYSLSVEANLANFSFRIKNQVFSTSNGSVRIYLDNGTYNYSAYSNKYNNISGVLLVNKSIKLYLNFTLEKTNKTKINFRYLVTFTEEGLQLGTLWSVTMNGKKENSTSSDISFMLPNGTYTFVLGNDSNYTVSALNNTIVVRGGNITKQLNFSIKSEISPVNNLFNPYVYGFGIFIVSLVSVTLILIYSYKKKRSL